jgi:hypothetical protein
MTPTSKDTGQETPPCELASTLCQRIQIVVADGWQLKP